MDMDFINRLRKGDKIEGPQVLQLLGLRPEDVIPGSVPPEVRLASYLEKELHRIGRPWTVKASQGVVAVLTDYEAYQHNLKRHRAGVRKFQRSLAGMAGVETHTFRPEDRSECESAHRKIAAQYLAIKTVKVAPSSLVQPSKTGR